MVYKKSVGERIFDFFNYCILSLLLIIALYPCYYVLVASISNPNEIFASNGILFYPKGFTLGSYKEVIESAEIWIGYRNTLFYVVAGTFVSVFITIITAFGLTRKGLPGKNILMFLIMFTMYFSGGLIPTYMVVRGIGLLDSPLTLIVLHAVTTYNLIIAVSYFRNMPPDLEEAAKIDGAGDYRIFFEIMLPLAKPITAVLALYYAVSIWNDYMNALIYLSDRKLFPLQMVLREILIQGNTESVSAGGSSGDAQAYAENLKYAIIVVSTIPILCVYPFIQKYFVKGVMVGAIKG